MSFNSSPFLRAYPLELDAFDFPPSAFLQFLDELNRVVVVSPPVRVVGLAGSIVGLVPEPTAQIVGASIEASSHLVAYGMNKGRSELFLRDANQKLFAPRGLKAEIVKLEVVAKIAGIPILNEEGKVDKNTQLLAPVEGNQAELSTQLRRLIALAPWTSPLELMPNDYQVAPDGMLNKMHAAASNRQRKKEEAKSLEKRAKAQKRGDKRSSMARDDFDKAIDKLDREEAKLRTKEVKKPERLEKELRKLDKEREKVQRESDEQMGRVEEKKEKASIKDVEEAAMRKILWLLIRRMDRGGEVMSPAFKEYEDQASAKADSRYAGSSAR
jgi:hypothetical protein